MSKKLPQSADGNPIKGRLEHEQEAFLERQEFASDRRTFLKLMGFSLAGAGLAGCSRGGVHKAIPNLEQTETMVPGKAFHYASTCGSCSAACGLLVKTREGRPVKLEGNPAHPLSLGGLCAMGQASMLELYDSTRLQKPTLGGTESSWSDLDGLLTDQGPSTRVRVLTGSINSPSAGYWMTQYLQQFDDGQHIQYDALSSSAILKAHLETHGIAKLPRYRFDKAEVILSVGADFLGSWISPVEYTKAYTSRRHLEEGSQGNFLHVQLEGRTSLTGTNADRRIPTPVSQYSAVLGHLAKAIAHLAGVHPELGSLPKVDLSEHHLEEFAASLWHARGHALVVADVNDLQSQKLVNLINGLLDAYGNTLDMNSPSLQKQGDDQQVLQLLEDMEAGKVDSLILAGVNPVYDHPFGARFAEAMKKVGLTAALCYQMDETSSLAGWAVPMHHPLEAWGDAEPVAGTVSTQQPTITPRQDSRSLVDCLGLWSGAPGQGQDLVQEAWRQLHPGRWPLHLGFTEYWQKAVHDGVAKNWSDGLAIPEINKEIKTPDWSHFSAQVNAPAQSGLELELFASVGMGDGTHAHNPWLHEMPDPVTKLTWGNALSVAPVLAEEKKWQEGQLVKISTKGGDVTLPLHIQPGQHPRVVSAPLGFGRLGTERFSGTGPDWWERKGSLPADKPVGRKVVHLQSSEQVLMGVATGVSLSANGGIDPLASSQMFHSLQMPNYMNEEDPGVRGIVAFTSLEEYNHDPEAGKHHLHHNDTLWEDVHKYDGPKWGMAVDLSACTGCSACVLGCQSENNVPVVGRDEILMGRDMAWMRLDRYFEDDGDKLRVIHQPMMCAHCDNAPCETVCPVLATVHSAEGLNQMAYNRCVGTRYCANNCPYKVRRFNWFDYPLADEGLDLALNPDVVVRSRGVMEKCSMCVQRIQDGKARALEDGRVLTDGDIKTACQQSCPADAIVFGDLNDPHSKVSKLKEDPRHFKVLEELGIRPAVGYMTQVKNRKPDGDKGQGHG